jgi:chemotaxis protein MotB
MSETDSERTPVPEPRRGGGGEAPIPRMERRKGAVSEMDADAWMVTFSDLLNLLMTFFVLMFASQDPVPPEKLYEAFGQSSGVFGLFRTGFLERLAVVTRQDVSQDLVQVFLDEIGAADIEVKQEQSGLVVTLPTDAYFRPGSADLNAQAVQRIDRLSAFLVATGHRIRVEGHSDDRERVAGPFPSRYELSVARAHRVLLRLVSQGVADGRLSLVGYGPGHPRFSNASRQGRAGNRRVEIVILNRRGPTP